VTDPSLPDPRRGELAAFVACAPGLEALVADELGTLGVTRRVPEPGGVEVRTHGSGLARLLLGCGLGLDAWVHVARFEARHFRQLERAVRSVPWADLLPPNPALRITVRSRHSKLFHTEAVRERLARFIEAPGGGEAAVELRARLSNDVCTLSLGAAGAPLHRRGYRLETSKAPLREDLARALLVLAGWPARPGALVDPMCGSGTLLIEGALLAARRAPGLGREFASEAFPFLDPAVFAEQRARAAEAAAPPGRSERPVLGSDRDAGAVAAARRNAARADVAVEFAGAALSGAPFLAHPPVAGLWASNPPHGRRVSAGRDLLPLMQTIGRRFRELPGSWRLALAVADRRAAEASGVPLVPRRVTDHGGRKIHLLTSP